MELLLVIRDPWRQRRNMPMHMGITLLAAQTQQIGTFDLDRRFHCPRHLVHQSHQLEVSVLSEISHDVLMMDLRSHEDVS
ncbi:hypothetical protein ATM97_09160 [Nocardia sp. MH4]|nr:hypothetical protein [Nocardia sp. MH4]